MFCVSSNSIHSGVKLENYVAMVKAELGVNQTLAGSNISFGLLDRNLINGAFLAIVLEVGVTCPIVDVVKLRPSILAVT
jgi:cobalamin-dependent methionine synthase I